MTELLSLVIGLLVGYWAKEVYIKLNQLHEDYVERKQAKEVGVVRPSRRPVNNQPIDLSSETGGIRRLSPDQYILANQRERDEKVKRMYS